MSGVQLLDKTRKIGKLLHNNNSSKVVFNDICAVMQDILESNVLVISRKGKVLGIDNDPHVEVIHELIKDKQKGYNTMLAFVIQMDGIKEVRPNIKTHPEFGIAMEEAGRAGVEVVYIKCHVEPDSLSFLS